MNERLLSEQECQQIFAEVYGKDEAELEAIHKFISTIAIAQDAKTTAARDQWWIKTLELNCGDGHDRPYIQIGVQEWQDFKQSLEVKE